MDSLTHGRRLHTKKQTSGEGSYKAVAMEFLCQGIGQNGEGARSQTLKCRLHPPGIGRFVDKLPSKPSHPRAQKRANEKLLQGKSEPVLSTCPFRCGD